MVLQWPIWLGIMAVCGAIAYMGDTLGRKLGKKRLSVFGLRPRRTAVLVTTLTGCFIFTVTIASVVTMSKEHRRWVLSGPEIVKELQSKQVELRQRNEELKNLTKELDKTGEDYDRLKDSILKAQASLADATGRLAEMGRIKDDLQRSNSRAESKLRTATSRLASAEERVADRNRQIADLDRHIEEFRRTNDTYAKQNQELERDNLALEKSVGELTTRQQEIIRDNGELERKRSELEARTTDLSVRVTELEMLAAKYGAGTAMLRSEPILFSRGAEIVRMSLEGGQPASTNLAIVDTVMEQARQVAVSRGAGAGADGERVHLLERVAVSDTGEQVPISPEDVKRALAQEIEKISGGAALIAFAAINTVAGEPLVIDIKAIPNPKVISAGEELAAKSLDFQASDDDLVNLLISFLREDVGAAARSRNMIPISGQSIGNVTYGRLFDLIRQIREIGKDVIVHAVAKADTRAADRLDLEFRLEGK